MASTAHTSEQVRQPHDVRLWWTRSPRSRGSARADGSTDFFNQRWLEYTGLSTEQARDWGWTVALHPHCLIETILIIELNASTGDHSHLLYPWGHNTFHRCFEIRSIARDESQAVDFRGGSNKRISSFYRAAHGFTPGHKPAAGIRYPKVYRQDSPLKPRSQILPQPCIEMVAAPAGSESFNAKA
jgi:hypothetical protein